MWVRGVEFKYSQSLSFVLGLLKGLGVRAYRLERRLSAFFSFLDILNEPFIGMEKTGNNPAVASFHQKFGVTPTIDVKTTF